MTDIRTELQPDGQWIAIDADSYEAESDSVGSWSSSIVGYGKTEQDAIDDLMSELADREPAPNDPEVSADEACEQAINALDTLMVLINRDDTFQTVTANKIFVGQIVNRANTLANSLMAKQQPTFKVVNHG